MTVNKTMRILTIYCLFYDCAEVELRAITNHIPISRKTIQRDIDFLEKAGLIRSHFDRKLQAFIPQSTEGIQPDFPENKTQRRYMERIIRLCCIIRNIDENEDPIRWYQSQFPHLSARTRQRDFALLNEMGISIEYIASDGFDPGYWFCQYPGCFALDTLE